MTAVIAAVAVGLRLHRFGAPITATVRLRVKIEAVGHALRSAGPMLLPVLHGAPQHAPDAGPGWGLLRSS